jgi:hypothetical protein
MQYVYMAHFFSNPLSMFTLDAPSDRPLELSPQLADKLRLLPSFQEGIEAMLDSEGPSDLRPPADLVLEKAGDNAELSEASKDLLEAQVDLELLSDDDSLFSSMSHFRKEHRRHVLRRRIAFDVLLALQDA